MFDTFVISLINADAGQHSHYARDRLYKTLSSCQRHDWTVTVFDAVNGYKIDPTVWTTIGVKQPKKKLGSVGKFGDKPGAHGCFLSHFFLWQKVITDQKPIIVLEDDAEIIAPMPIIMQDHFDVIKLHAPRQRCLHSTVGEWSPCTFAYYISVKGAAKLIAWTKVNGAKYTDKLIGSNIVHWTYLESPAVKLRAHQGSSTDPIRHPY